MAAENGRQRAQRRKSKLRWSREGGAFDRATVAPRGESEREREERERREKQKEKRKNETGERRGDAGETRRGRAQGSESERSGIQLVS